MNLIIQLLHVSRVDNKVRVLHSLLNNLVVELPGSQHLFDHVIYHYLSWRPVPLNLFAMDESSMDESSMLEQRQLR